MDVTFRYSRPLLKRVKIFLPLFCNCHNISYASFGEKKSYRLRHFQANKHKLALLRNVTKLVLAAIFKQNIYFQILFQKCKFIIYVLLL